jgi:hypothetical protein
MTRWRFKQMNAEDYEQFARELGTTVGSELFLKALQHCPPMEPIPDDEPEERPKKRGTKTRP